MTTYKILEKFAHEIQIAIENVRLETKENVSKKPSVKLGYLESLKVDDEESDAFPHIIVRYLNGDEGEDESSINVKLIFGVYSKDDKGWIDVLHMIEVVKQYIQRKRVFDYFSVEYPLKISLPEEQPYPSFYGFMELKFNIPIMEIEGDEEPWPA